MIRVLIVLFWLGLLVGTLLAHNIVANWAVTLAGPYFLARWWRGRRHQPRLASPVMRSPEAGSAGPEDSRQAHVPAAPAGPLAPHSRWTADRTHGASRRWY